MLFSNNSLKFLIYHANSKASQKEMSKLLSVNPYFLAEYSTASINYNLKEVVMIISLIRDYDLYSKGVKIKKANSDLLKELITRIFNSV